MLTKINMLNNLGGSGLWRGIDSYASRDAIFQIWDSFVFWRIHMNDQISISLQKE
jgi:hypothetical protein